jgi:hypothetical protein
MTEQIVRQETPERWQKALSRAISHNLAYMELIGGDGAFAIASTRDEEAGYIATVGSCTCPAGRGGDPVCCHRALVRALTGVMPVDAPVNCPSCNGGGVVYYRSGNQEPCPHCGGSGIRPDHRLHDAPAVPMVATAA